MSEELSSAVTSLTAPMLAHTHTIQALHTHTFTHAHTHTHICIMCTHNMGRHTPLAAYPNMPTHKCTHKMHTHTHTDTHTHTRVIIHTLLAFTQYAYTWLVLKIDSLLTHTLHTLTPHTPTSPRRSSF